MSTFYRLSLACYFGSWKWWKMSTLYRLLSNCEVVLCSPVPRTFTHSFDCNVFLGRRFAGAGWAFWCSIVYSLAVNIAQLILTSRTVVASIPFALRWNVGAKSTSNIDPNVWMMFKCFEFLKRKSIFLGIQWYPGVGVTALSQVASVSLATSLLGLLLCHIYITPETIDTGTRHQRTETRHQRHRPMHPLGVLVTRWHQTLNSKLWIKNATGFALAVACTAHGA